MDEANRFLGSNPGENTAAKSILEYLRKSIERGTEVDFKFVKQKIDASKLSPQELEEIRTEAVKGVDLYSDKICKDPENDAKKATNGAYAAIANYAGKRSGYKHRQNSKSLEPGD